MINIKENTIELRDIILNKLENMSIINNMVNVTILNTIVEKSIFDEHILSLKKTNNGNIIISDDIGYEKTIFNNMKIYDCISLRINTEFMNILSDFSIELKQSLSDRIFYFFSKVFYNTCISNLISKYSSNKDWILVGNNDKILQILSLFPSFKKTNIENNTNITNIGTININNKNITVYKSESIRNRIYFGNYNDVNLLISKDIKLEQIKTKNTYKLTLYYKYIRSKRLIPYITF